jgi:ARID/BRIGHT DNA binding domain
MGDASGAVEQKVSSSRPVLHEAFHRPFIEELVTMFPDGSPEGNFYKHLEVIWKQLNLDRIYQRTPAIAGRPLDLFQCYNFITEHGGYNVVNGLSLGWKAVANALNFNVRDVKRLKMLYEMLLLEYELRVSEGWNPSSDTPYEGKILVSDHPFIMPGQGLFKFQADKYQEEIQKLLKFVTGSKKVIIVPDDYKFKPLINDPVITEGDELTGSEVASQKVTPQKRKAPVKKESVKKEPAAAAIQPQSPKVQKTVIKTTTLSKPIPFFVPQPTYGVGNVRRITYPISSTAVISSSPYVGYRSESSMNKTLQSVVSKVILPNSITNSDMVTSPELDEVWASSRFSRVVNSSQYLNSERDSGVSGYRSHDSTCSNCSAKRKNMLKVKPVQSQVVEAGQTIESDTESAAEDEENETTHPKAKKSGRPSLFRAWALCAKCSTATCYSCVKKLSDISSSVEEISSIHGSSSASGQRVALSDTGLWLCSQCEVEQKVHSSSDALPWCSFCHQSLSIVPTYNALPYFMSVGEIPTSDPNVRACTCKGCGLRTHVECAASYGLTVVSDSFFCRHCMETKNVSTLLALNNVDTCTPIFVMNESTRESIISLQVS